MINAHERCLIAVDLDDTALQDLRELNPVTRMVLRKAAADGHRVMLATARPSCMTMEHYQALELDTIWDGKDLIAGLSRIIGGA